MENRIDIFFQVTNSDILAFVSTLWCLPLYWLEICGYRISYSRNMKTITSRFCLPPSSLSPQFNWTYYPKTSQIAKFMGQTWGPPGSCRPQKGPMLAPWILLSGIMSLVRSAWYAVWMPPTRHTHPPGALGLNEPSNQYHWVISSIENKVSKSWAQTRRHRSLSF